MAYITSTHFQQELPRKDCTEKPGNMGSVDQVCARKGMEEILQHIICIKNLYRFISVDPY